MASHGRAVRNKKKNNKFFLHRSGGSHSTHTAVTAIDSIPTVVTAVDSASVCSDESASDDSVDLGHIKMSKKQRYDSIKKSRRIKMELIENPFTHSGPDAPEHIERLGFMNCKNTCVFPQKSVNKFGTSQFDACMRCYECLIAGRISVSEFYGYVDDSYFYDDD